MQVFYQGTEAIRKPLETVVGIVEKRASLPILAHVLIRKSPEYLDLVTSDMSIQITTRLNFGRDSEADFETNSKPEILDGQEEFSDDNNILKIAVPAHKFMNIVRVMPTGAMIEANLSESKINLTGADSSFTLQTLPGADYPEADFDVDWKSNFSIKAKDLKKILSLVSCAMAQNDIRYYLNGMLLVIEPGKLHGVATDGHRLSHAAESVEGVTESDKVIIPRKTVEHLLRLLEDSNSDVRISVSSRSIRFVFGNIEIISKQVEGKFPDFDKVIPKGYGTQITIKRSILNENLNRANILVNEDKLHSIKLHFANDLLTISSSNLDQEESKMEIGVVYNDKPIQMGFNALYLLDVLNVLSSYENVILSMSGESNSSLLISVPEDDEFKYVVMPLRI
ncbi:DNA polymerase III subunit beta [Taylorella asinigenitalis]|uniref:DNA polymerase III subunit beta n=1 Tax=Taylorella asinigenitalis TaxID=84590 RepID=UPI00048CE544|nr:DNA polymerase III subunit beta [Taylorella asinigenitalis]